jgi:16S rRNA (adenine1518-N6/adenine1519-N6)-dimethyltransferase
LVRPKKHLGQHFLTDQNIARKIVDGLTGIGGYTNVLEVGPGTGVLTKFLLEDDKFQLHCAEVDSESVDFLKTHYPLNSSSFLLVDFLKLNLNQDPFGKSWSAGLIGNFPYNISSQIFFRVLDETERFPEVVGMIQKEVADRILANHGNKTYGILSVLLQTYYRVERLLDVPPTVFNPPPKVMSTVIRLQRIDQPGITVSYSVLKMLVKTAFSQRRKTLRNALKSITFAGEVDSETLAKRAEQLSVAEFATLAAKVAISEK